MRTVHISDRRACSSASELAGNECSELFARTVERLAGEHGVDVANVGESTSTPTAAAGSGGKGKKGKPAQTPMAPDAVSALEIDNGL